LANDGRRLTALLDALVADALAQHHLRAATAAAVRYVLTIQAINARGNACRFPRCPCSIMDCSRRPSG
jgi:hypothetical protein